MEKKTLEHLNEEQEALLEDIYKEYLGYLACTEPDMKAIENWLTLVYELYELPLPPIEIMPSPQAAFARATELTGEKQSHSDWVGLADIGWVAFYDYFIRIGVLDANSKEEKSVLALREFLKCAWDLVLLDERALVIRRPIKLEVDQNGNLHCQTGPCIEWQDGLKDWAWHGVWVPERVITEPKSYTKEEYEQITNVEVRRALGEAAGWDHIVSLLGAKSVDKWSDDKTGLNYELFSTLDEGEDRGQRQGQRQGQGQGQQGQKWLKKLSPKLKDGSQPVYFSPVHEELKTAQAARKWMATRLTAAQCEADPVLVYGIET